MGKKKLAISQRKMFLLAIMQIVLQKKLKILLVFQDILLIMIMIMVNSGGLDVP